MLKTDFIAQKKAAHWTAFLIKYFSMLI